MISTPLFSVCLKSKKKKKKVKNQTDLALTRSGLIVKSNHYHVLFHVGSDKGVHDVEIIRMGKVISDLIVLANRIPP